MAQNGPKWSEMFRQMVQMSTGIPTPNCLTKNGEKLPETGQKWPKGPKKGENQPKMV